MFSGRYPDWLCAVILPFPFQHSILKRSFPRRSGGFLFCVSQGDFARCDERTKTLSLAHSRAAALTRDCATIRLFFVFMCHRGVAPVPPSPFSLLKRKGRTKRKGFTSGAAQTRESGGQTTCARTRLSSSHLADNASWVQAQPARTNRNIVIMVIVAAQACGRSDIIAQCL